MMKLSSTYATPIRKTLLKKEETLAIAESVTAGLLQYALSTIPDASQFWQGGVTAFNIAQKYRHLQVEPIHAIDVNCVSLKVAKQMAMNVCTMFTSDWGIAVTGYATPVPESAQKVFAYFAISYRGKIKKSGKLIPTHSDPPGIQAEYVETVIQQFVKALSTYTK